jgi:hypothetical protein
LGVGSWELGVGSWELGVGSWKLRRLVLVTVSEQRVPLAGNDVGSIV